MFRQYALPWPSPPASTGSVAGGLFERLPRLRERFARGNLLMLESSKGVRATGRACGKQARPFSFPGDQLAGELLFAVEGADCGGDLVEGHG
jgi:hypothetical protein